MERKKGERKMGLYLLKLRLLFSVILLLIISFISVLPLEAAFEERPFPRVWGQGGAFLTMEGDLHCLHYNPAGLFRVSESQLVINHGQLFQLEDLAWDAVILGGSRFAGSYQRFGFALYQEEIYVLGTGFSLRNHFAAGLGIHCQTLQIPNFLSLNQWAIKLGFLGFIGSKYQWGLTYYFPVSPVEEIIREVWSAGIGWEPGKQWRILLDVIGERGEKVSYRMGGEVRLAEIIVLRCGFESSPPRYTLGWGIETGAGEIDYAYLSHPVLPGSHLYSLTIRW